MGFYIEVVFFALSEMGIWTGGRDRDIEINIYPLSRGRQIRFWARPSLQAGEGNQGI